ncbi:MAG: c-type cytochrome [Vicinamibacterales bacterium]
MKGLRFVVVLALVAGSVATATPAMAQPAAGGQAPPPPKNLQILKPDNYGPAMRAFTQALGVQCNYCHVMEPARDMASDEKQAKKTARMMLQMVGHVNETIGSGTGKAAADVVRVQCWTCHRGKAIPETPPPAAPPAAAPRQ